MAVEFTPLKRFTIRRGRLLLNLEKNKNVTDLSEIAILITSCDKYADLWPVVIESMRRFWHPLPSNIYLMSNFLKTSFPGITSILVGEDNSWSDNLSIALSKIAERYVMLYIDDLILYRPIDGNLICVTIRDFITNDGEYLRLNPYPPGISCDGLLNLIPVGDLYRPSTVFSIWKKDILSTLLQPGESAWEFEILGAKRANSYIKWYSTKEWLVPYLNLVIKGKVNPLALWRLKRCGLNYISERQRMNTMELIYQGFCKCRERIFRFIPRRYRQSIRLNFRIK
jgi:hypothetical protein